MKIGSLFSGYGGLEMGVQSVIGGYVAWHVEFDPAPSKILEHRFPGVPNYGDITNVDWASVEPVDVLTGGFPCQDVSLAGLRRGLKEGTRSGLWSEFARAIGHLRPGLVVIENVRGLLSAVASGPVESDPWGLGDGSARPSLRALGAVLGDLADLGYDARWCGVRAADAGAPHGRFRVFVLAHPAGQPWSFRDGDDVRTRRGALRRVSEAGRGVAADPQHVSGYGTGRAWHGWPEPAAGPATDANDHESVRKHGEQPWRTAAPRGGTRTLSDSICGRCGDPDYLHDEDGFCAGACGGRCYDLASDATGGRRDRRAQEPQRNQVARIAAPRSGGAVGWGEYGPAITRWEAALGRRAPNPTRPDGKNGAHRLNPEFVEWMMGLPEGWLTAPEVGLTRAQQLKALGNGVVPQQAALALSTLLREEVAA